MVGPKKVTHGHGLTYAVSHLWRVAKGPPAESGMWWLRRAGQACGQMRVVTSWPDVFPPLLLSHRVLSLLGPSNLKTGKQKLGPETAAPRRKEGAARGVGVVVRCVDELLSQCLVIVDGKGPFLWCGGRQVDMFRKPVCSAIGVSQGALVAGGGGGAK